MTRYDPFSYGQVPLAGKDAAPSAAPSAAPAAPEDMLFAAPPSAPKSGAATTAADDNDWAPPANDGFADLLNQGAPAPSATATTSSDPLAFGAEVLGETAPAAAAAPVRKPAGLRPTPLGKAKEPARAKEPLPRRPLATLPPAAPRRPSAFGVVAPTAFAAGALAFATWLVLAQENPILGGIVAAAGLVGGAMGWLMLRR